MSLEKVNNLLGNISDHAVAAYADRLGKFLIVKNKENIKIKLGENRLSKLNIL